MTSKIKSLQVFHVPLTSHETYYMSEGKTCDTVTSVILKLRDDQGRIGWGEVCPIPHYLPAYAEGVAPAMAYLAPVLIGQSFDAPEALMAKCDAYLQGHVYAKSALETALWDLFGQASGKPLYELLGGRRVKDMPLYHSITCVEPDEMARIARAAKQAGMKQFQVKLGADNEPEADIARLRKVREVVADGDLAYGDWNAGTASLDAIRVGRAVAGLDIMLEQPCPTIEDCARVKSATGLPMKQDETAHDLESLLRAHRLDAMDAVAIKLSKFGGLSKSRLARDLCLYLGAKMCVEDTWGSDITTAALLHLAASTDPKFLMNTCDLSGYVSPRLAPKAPIRRDGRIAPPEGAGLGIEVDESQLGQAILELEE